MTVTKTISTEVEVRNGDYCCTADTKSDCFWMRRTSDKDGWTLRIDAKDVITIIEVLGGAYDWRKHKLSEKQ